MGLSRKEEYFSRLENLEEISVFSPVMIHIREVANNPNSSASDLARVIQHDHGLSSKILKLANSVYYAPGSRKSKTLTQAVVTIGFQEVKNLALSISLMESFRGKVSDKFKFERFWAHSLATAIAAYRLSTVISKDRQEEAFVAGFLHDLGKLVIAYETPDDWSEIVSMVDRGFSIRKAELYQIGTYHTHVGAYIARKWAFPESLAVVMRDHHPLRNPQPNKESGRDVLADIVFLANLFGNLIFRSPLGTRASMEDIKEYADTVFGLSGAMFGRMVQSMRNAVMETAEELSMNLASPISIEDIPESATREELQQQLYALQRTFARKTREFKTLQKLTLDLLLTNDVNEIYILILKTLQEGGLFDRVVAFQVDWKSQKLVGWEASGFKETKWLRDFSVNLANNEDILVSVAKKQEAVYYEEEKRRKGEAEMDPVIAEQMLTRQWGIFPVVALKKSRAVILVDNEFSNEAINEEMVFSLSEFAKQAGTIIERLKLLKEE